MRGLPRRRPWRRCPPPPLPYGVVWSASQQSSTRQHNKGLISETIGAFRSGRRVAPTRAAADTATARRSGWTRGRPDRR